MLENRCPEEFVWHECVLRFVKHLQTRLYSSRVRHLHVILPRKSKGEESLRMERWVSQSAGAMQRSHTTPCCSSYALYCKYCNQTCKAEHLKTQPILAIQMCSISKLEKLRVEVHIHLVLTLPTCTVEMQSRITEKLIHYLKIIDVVSVTQY